MDMSRVREAIRKELPGKVGEVLQERLKLADVAENLRRDLKIEKEAHKRDHEEQRATNADLKKLKEEFAKVLKTNAWLLEVQRNAAVTLTEAKAMAAEAKAQLAERLVLAVFQNPQKVRTIQRTKSILEKDAYGTNNGKVVEKDETVETESASPPVDGAGDGGCDG